MISADWARGILGVPYDSTPEQIRIAYRDLVQVWHPDRFGHDARLSKKAEEKLKEINRAYELLAAEPPRSGRMTEDHAGRHATQSRPDRRAESRAEARPSDDNGSRQAGATASGQRKSTPRGDTEREHPPSVPPTSIPTARTGWRLVASRWVSGNASGLATVAVFAALAWFGSRPSGFPEVAVSSGRLTPELLMAGAYHAPGDSNRVRLSGGYHKEHDGGFVALDELMAFGDLNGDGREDAAVTLKVSGGGSGTFHYLVAILGERGRAVQGPYFDLGDRIEMKRLQILGGSVVVQMMDHGPNDGLCCPTVSRDRRFVLESGQLVER
jgi:hypothetical protein